MTLISKVTRHLVKLTPPFKRKINFMNMTAKIIGALSQQELRDALINPGVNLSGKYSKAELVKKLSIYELRLKYH